MKSGAPDLLLGVHAVEAALADHPDRVERIWFAEEAAPRLQPLISETRRMGVRFLMVPRARLDELAEGGRHQGVVAAYQPLPPRQEREIEPFLAAIPLPLVLVLDGVQDPHNLGACLRTAEAAGAHAVVVPKANSVSLSPGARRAAAGAADRVPLFQVANLARVLMQLRKSGLWIVGAAARAPQSAYTVDFTAPVALVLGGEERGLRRLTQEQCDLAVHLPLAGACESLNVSVAAGVLLYEAVRQRQAQAATGGAHHGPDR
ncbi:MAG TPA: 23S rRNA (guanosine(2251)-2'-O)-methyltransferase RlmB [Acidiferrobacteraceae bacterium]|nr:23S rRNA (guanosine(2251)-2'-O)-methyltransferase RlmB [Acidiferrobacteraceae bacterium]